MQDKDLCCRLVGQRWRQQHVEDEEERVNLVSDGGERVYQGVHGSDCHYYQHAKGQSAIAIQWRREKQEPETEKANNRSATEDSNYRIGN